MKIVFLWSLCVFLLSGNYTAKGQGAALEEFYILRDGNSLTFHWTIGEGYFCSDVQVMGSRDSLHYISLYTYPGICGTNDRAEHYSWTWNDPWQNVPAWYKLDISFAGASDAVPYFFPDYGSGNVALFPLPVQDGTRMYFPNATRKSYHLEIYDARGMMTKTMETTGEWLDFSDLNLVPGMYCWRLINDQESWQGRFTAL